MIGAYRGQWVRPPLESSLPHEIVDTPDGRRRVMNGPWMDLSATPIRGVFKSKAAATRYLKTLIRHYDKRRHDGIDDPRNWTVRPVKEGA